MTTWRNKKILLFFQLVERNTIYVLPVKCFLLLERIKIHYTYSHFEEKTESIRECFHFVEMKPIIQRNEKFFILFFLFVKKKP